MHKIIVIDDSPENLVLIRAFLGKGNYQVITAMTANEGLEKIYSDKPDLILLDVMMPDVNGLEFCRQLTQSEETKNIPVIFVSGRVSSEDVQAGFQAGAVDYIKRPVDKIELIERIEQTFKRLEETKIIVETEKSSTLSATAVGANHALKQPLTLINLNVTAARRLLAKEGVDKEAILQKLDSIQSSVAQISGVLDNMLKLEKAELKDYVGGEKMVDVTSRSEGSKHPES